MEAFAIGNSGDFIAASDMLNKPWPHTLCG